ncbi:ABC-2 type transport system ATP-binding protein [Natronospira proteinivora]|uniref:ABC-2 type transport system ATP-binding protein n=1 Tax=Natronospira proteinivora TaxID=1807133 RepID=A0ABT1GCR8_9GAMM|nr:ABC transporter ATP-binding protein [Natronospira proteinivora]MCP1727732.1 ABC-2 type transport system ATP-binding protein [Natronospira proteinivora]
MSNPAPGKPTPLLQLSGVQKQWPGRPHPALNGLDLTVAEGRILGLLGPNGAGKTTLLSVLMGLTPADAGRFELDGQPLDRRRTALRRIAGLVPQHIALYPSLSGQQNLDFFAGLLWRHPRERQRAVDRCAAIADLGEALNYRVEQYSGGQKRRLNLAVGLLGEPRLLLLDEPTVGIDPQSRHFILESIRRLCRDEGMTVIHTTHYMEEVEQLCDDVAIMDEGRVLLNDSLDQALRQARALGRLQLRLEGSAPNSLLAALRKEGIVVEAVRDHELSLSLAECNLSLSAITELIEAQQQVISTLRFGASLETLFLSLTGRALRE